MDGVEILGDIIILSWSRNWEIHCGNDVQYKVLFSFVGLTASFLDLYIECQILMQFKQYFAFYPNLMYVILPTPLR